MDRRRSADAVLLPLLALPAMLVVLCLGIYLGGHPSHLPGFARNTLVGDKDTRVTTQALEAIRHDYYRPITAGQANDAAINGVVTSLHDRFSNYFSPKQYKEFQEADNQQFDGVGIEVRQVRDGLLVERVYDGTPAKAAGIRAGDVIVKAAGRSLARKARTDRTELIRGKAGTKVRLQVRTPGKAPRDLLVPRAQVSVPVVASRMATTPDGTKVAQVSLSAFSPGAHGEVRGALDPLLKKGAKAVLLDLRHDPGGLLEEGRLVASIFIPDGTIVTTRGRTQAPETLTAAGDAIDKDIPVVVLVDGATASASEIVAGAIQDRHRGKLVGVKTFGKGVYQEVRELSNGGAIKLTIGQFFLPSGRNLGGPGVTAGTAVSPGAGLKPDVIARDDPKTRGDEAVAAGLRELDAIAR